MTSKDDGVVFVVKRVIKLLKGQDDVLIDVFFDLVFFYVSENDFSILVMVSIPDRFLVRKPRGNHGFCEV